MPPVRTYYLLSLGCAKNTVDSDSMAALMEREGLAPAGSLARADVLLVNTCGFIAPAREESISALRRLAAAKRRGQWLIAAGCLSQRDGEALTREISGLDGVMGTRRWMDIPAVLEQLGSRTESEPVIHLPPVPAVGAWYVRPCAAAAHT